MISYWERNHDLDKSTITFLTMCPICSEKTNIEVPSKDWDYYQNGAKIQEAFHYLSEEDREKLMTGYCNECYDLVCGGM